MNRVVMTKPLIASVLAATTVFSLSACGQPSAPAEPPPLEGAAIGGVLVAALAAVGVYVGSQVHERQAFRRELQSVEELVQTWERQPPQGVDPHVWREVTIVVYNGLVRARLAESLGAAAESVRILYGGSVTPENAAALFAERDIDGALVGGASLAADRLLKIVAAAADACRVHGEN